MVVGRSDRSTVTRRRAGQLSWSSLLSLSTVVPPLVLVVVLGAIFGWMHAPQGPLGVLVTGALGGLLGLLFLWTGGLLAPLVAHYLINMLQLVRAREARFWLQEY